MKKEKTLLVIMTLAVLLIVGTMTYAFFSAGVNNDNRQEVSITTGDMKLTFADGNNGFASELSIGQSATKTFTIENTGSLDTGANLYWLDFTNNYTLGSLTYTLEYSDSENGEYKILQKDENVPQSTTPSKILLQDKIAVPVKTKYYYKLTITLNNLEDVDQNADLTAVMNTKFTLEGTDAPESYNTLAALGLIANSGTPDFSQVATTDEGIFAAQDDYGTSYYFRGAVENNYVYFANYWWRIIRVNGDGSLRIIYDGTSKHANGDESDDRVAGESGFNDEIGDDSASVGYMYGLVNTTTDANRCLILENNTVVDKQNTYTTESLCTNAGGKWTTTAYEATNANVKSSTMKENLDNWYKTNIVDEGYSNAISDTLFCNDRSLVKGYGYGSLDYWRDMYDNADWNIDIDTTYGAFGRLNTYNNPNISPILKCPQQNDAFTVSDEIRGNGDLTYPIGLITADEVSMAGGKYDTVNNNYYLFKPDAWHIVHYTLSPDRFEPFFEEPNMFVSRGRSLSSDIAYDYTDDEIFYYSPVVNLTIDYARTLKWDDEIGAYTE